MVKISKAKKNDISQIAQIASQCFSGMQPKTKAVKWVKCNFSAWPRAQYFTAKEKSKILGYILWVEEGGFRKESVWELEQIAVSSDFQGRGVGRQLILQSLENIKKYLKNRGSVLKLVEVTTGTDNKAQELYQKTLGAKKEATVRNFFRGDEVIMIARFSS
ncbi:MAG: GNAT family N-acetyltransferase [Candidatus Pacebacteria bacterium]|nr:GNAT family N-acetyltransferase [Candidatus Paceibacterota bacterium]